MKQRKAVLQSFKTLLGIYDRRLEDLRQRPVPLDVRMREVKKISQTVVAGVREIKKAIQQEEQHNG